MKLIEILDKKLVAFLDQYSDTQESVGTTLLRIIQNMDNAEVIIPVLGMQGMGKSTLINGLLKRIYCLMMQMKRPVCLLKLSLVQTNVL